MNMINYFLLSFIYNLFVFQTQLQHEPQERFFQIKELLKFSERDESIA